MAGGLLVKTSTKKDMTNITYSKVHSTKTEGILGMALGGASLVSNSIAGQANEAVSSRRAYKYQTKLNNQGVDNSKILTDYNMTKQKEMWDATNIEAQKAHYKAAGMNPALMYGMGGGGGTTANVATGSANGGSAPSGGGKVAPIDIAQLSLLQAQKENIQADTANKKSQVPVNEATVPKIQQDTNKSWQETNKLRLDNIITEVAQAVDVNGKDTEGDISKSAAVKERLGQVILQSKAIAEIGEKIDLMKKQGVTQEEMTGKLQREIQLLQKEVDWNEAGIQGNDIMTIINKIIQRLLK